MLRLLLAARADVGMRDPHGCILAHRLAECGAAPLLVELQQANVLDLEAVDSAGQTLLHKSAAGGHPSAVALLLQWGASPYPGSFAEDRG